ncbi:apolipoprotein N-acyltransferase [Victivallis sp. Marseille-Q1083]|uniref:apolipoprotein N-acyltransferase n=1 Tax=Victivallis sp. Marseille-Q1083 TaxID=2717288 RepID=UPI00158AFC22|nr:apolipoprotein N-acyltransferase [Victivallis sp. Marseille-Q1083]
METDPVVATPGNAGVPNEKYLLSKRRFFGYLLLMFGSGWLMSTALPPLNWHAVAFVALILPGYLLLGRAKLPALAGGFCYGLGWAFPSFYWLREINPVLPYLMAPVLGLYLAVWALGFAVLHRWLLIPLDIQLAGAEAVRKFARNQPWRELFFTVAVSALYCIIEHLRSGPLPWNYLSATQWQNLSLIQICSVTGTYGVTFLIVFLNISIALAVRNGLRLYGSGRYPRPWPFLTALVLLMLALLFGVALDRSRAARDGATATVRLGLLQGDISQRRSASDAEAQEALDVYMELSRKVAPLRPDLLIWPETAVPFPLMAAHPLCESYRARVAQLILDYRVPMLLGSVDYRPRPDSGEIEVYNTALLLDTAPEIVDRYDKINPVPFGEYVPFRRWLPDWAIRLIDMNRDLTAGTDFSPLALPQREEIKLGMSICYEDVFPYIARREAELGANLLLVITNDAWYPTSSEPEQHLANAVFRAVETGLPMARCGNNSASCIILPNGKISDGLFSDAAGEADPVRRGRACGVLSVEVPLNPPPTFYTRFGPWFIGGCYLLAGAAFAVCFGLFLARKKALLKPFTPEESSSHD